MRCETTVLHGAQREKYAFALHPVRCSVFRLLFENMPDFFLEPSLVQQNLSFVANLSSTDGDQFSPGHLVHCFDTLLLPLVNKSCSFLAFFAIVPRRFRFFDQPCFMESLHRCFPLRLVCAFFGPLFSANFDCHASSLIPASSQRLLSIFSTEMNSLVMTRLQQCDLVPSPLSLLRRGRRRRSSSHLAS